MNSRDKILEGLKEQRISDDTFCEDNIIDEDEFIASGALEEGFTKLGSPIPKKKNGVLYMIQKWVGMFKGKKETKYTQKIVEPKTISIHQHLKRELDAEARHREMRRTMREQT